MKNDWKTHKERIIGDRAICWAGTVVECSKGVTGSRVSVK